MSSLPHSDLPNQLAFGDFEFSMSRLELRKCGEIVRLQQQPLKVLAALLRRPGEVVTREELRAEVWEQDIHLDFDDALNHAVKYLRDALGDRAGKPEYIETVPRRGYRLVATVREIELLHNSERQSNLPGAAAVEPLQVAVPQASMSFVSRGPRLRTVAGLSLAIAAVLVIVGWSWPSRPARVAGIVRLTHFGLATAAVSDGRRLYVGQEKGGTHNIVSFPADGSGEPTPLPLPFAVADLLDISPSRDSLLVAGSQSETAPSAVWIVPLSGGPPRRVGNIESDSAKWSPDGKKIAFAAEGQDEISRLYTTSPDGHDARLLASEATTVDSWSPDGRRIRFTRLHGATGGTSLWEVDAASGNVRPFLPERHDPRARWSEGQCCGTWTQDGRYFLYEEASGDRVKLLAVPEHGWFGRSRPEELYSSPLRVSATATTPDGHVLLIGWQGKRELARYDRQMRKFVPLFPGVEAAFISYSPDRQWVAYTSDSDRTLWKMRIATGEKIQLTQPPMQTFGPEWSPDGRTIAVHVLNPGKTGKIALVPAGGGTARILFEGDQVQDDDQRWSPDGSSLMFGRVWLDKNEQSTGSSICILDLRTGNISKVPGSKNIGPAAWSPNGRYVVAQSADLRKLMLFDFHTGVWKTIASGELIWFPHWSHDSESVIYQDAMSGEEQPIYRLHIATGKSQKIATRADTLRPDITKYRLVG
ncbi:MAG: winged helix-turn-helix domain-containing protein, partial [Terriglobales bacterium]